MIVSNSAYITTKKEFDKGVGLAVYVHWNGGRESVEEFLKECRKNDVRPPERDCYGWARLCQVIGNFFGGSLSVGIDNVNFNENLWSDNGIYIIENWEIVGVIDGDDLAKWRNFDQNAVFEHCDAVRDLLKDAENVTIKITSKAIDIAV